MPKKIAGQEMKEIWYEHPCTVECENAADLEEWEAERRSALLNTLMERSGVSKRLQRCTLENFHIARNPDAKTALQKVEDWIDHWPEYREAGRGLFLSGEVGTGKTHLAVAVMKELQEAHEVPCLMMSVPELLDDMRAEYDSREGRGRMVAQAKAAELLVLDDLGSEKITDWSIERLFVIIDHRYRNMAPTIYTSNLGYQGVREVFGERIASRMIESNKWVFMEGKDYRKGR